MVLNLKFKCNDSKCHVIDPTSETGGNTYECAVHLNYSKKNNNTDLVIHKYHYTLGRSTT